MQVAIRVCGVIAVALLVLGAVFFVVSSAFMCFDVCPSPDAFPGAALRAAGVTFGPGLLLALVTWGLFQAALARAGARWGLAVAIGVPIILGSVFVLSLAFVPPAALLPTTADEYGGWVRKFLLACLVTLGLVVAMIALAPPNARRAGAPSPGAAQP